ncbi:MAG: 16S rRNA (adenine(1518)-N(6)/adenine(1519)-N(6))-dimethyltransferase RsmA, partial [Clostridiales Family XIII bacterium]|nr:16S rRNA (adenine(1518)-N(6)/adenine(1519)-N(6))-dimethyltransferase RsmA [Clostridiales Family XIII bacterium]
VEIGPGFGALTAELSRRAGKVVAVEIDRRMIPVLEETLSGAANVEIVNEDFMTFDSERAQGSFKLVGNLPYYITSPIIAKALECRVKPERMVFMVQKEVAERLVAAPGSKVCGAISIFAGYHSRVTLAMKVSREVFLPKPNVDSAIIVMEPRPFARGKPKDETLFFAIVRAGFGQRRKMLRNALSVLCPDREKAEAVFARAGVAPTARAESLGVEEFIALADAMSEIE